MIIAEASTKTPEITFEEASGVFEISGRSYPEDLHGFWDPVINQMERIIASRGSTAIHFSLEYHNSGSTRILLNLIKFCENVAADGGDVRMKWHYDPEDEQNEEQGQDYQDLCALVDFKLVPIE